MISRERLLPILFILLAAAAAGTSYAGCGGGGSEDRTVSTSSLTNAEFVKRADAICARGRLRALRYQPSASGGQTGAAVAAAIEAGVFPAIQAVIDKLYTLGAPAGQKARVEAFLTAFQQGVDEGEDLEVPSFERLGRVLAKPGELAHKSGLQDCIYG